MSGANLSEPSDLSPICRKALVHFIYSLAWDCERVPWKKLLQQLTARGWKVRRLHERTLDGESVLPGPTYQPNLVSRARVLEWSVVVASSLRVKAPIEIYRGQELPKCREIEISLELTIRLFENGGGVATFLAKPVGQLDFIGLHTLLRLAANVDRGEGTEGEKETHDHLTAAFIDISQLSADASDLLPNESRESPTFGWGYISLHDVFRRLISIKHPRLPEKAPEIWIDNESLDTTDVHQDFQTPFVFIVGEVEEKEYWIVTEGPSREQSQKIASLVCKLTLDNRHIERDYGYISEDYMRAALPFSETRRALANLCLDRRLFFTTSRRGCIALTPDLVGLPSYFVIPSLLNLVELLRVRWHLSSIVSTRLDRAIAQLSLGSDERPEEILRSLFRWRAMFGSFLRDPIPILFDGGSVTDVAEVAEKQHWLPQLLVETERKLDCLERLLRDKLNVRRWEEMGSVNPQMRRARKAR
jgi:hypothetical protein